MYKLLIVDDEPLVQVGLKSMLNWDQFQIEICGIVGNGQEAFHFIMEQKPHIVIADIRMPVMSGLDLLKKCREEIINFPVFIILTSYEDFEYAREALRYQVSDYLVKLELTQDTLIAALRKAISQVEEILKQNHISSNVEQPSTFNIQTLKDRFFIRLINNLFENEEECLSQAKELNISFSSRFYGVSQLKIEPLNTAPMSSSQQITLYNSTLQMFHKIMSKYVPCQIISLDTRYWAAIFSFPNSSVNDCLQLLYNAFTETNEMLHNYYNVCVLSATGQILEQPLHLSSSYRDAKQLSSKLSIHEPLLFFDKLQKHLTLRNVFDMTLFRKLLRKAFDEFDEEALHSVFCSIFEVFYSNHPPYTQVMDAASNILYLTLTLLNKGEEFAKEIFSDEPDGYCSLYRQTSTTQILAWMNKLDNGLCQIFKKQKKNYKNHIVVNVKKYIDSHINEHLTLQRVASTFSISPNYLSQLFKKYNDIGFNEYITQMKVEKAKYLLRQEHPKVYEIAEQLGFESAFYFSKVFKKTTGISPKDYQNQNFS